MAEIYQGNGPNQILAHIRAEIRGGQSDEPSIYPDPWAEWGTTEEDRDRNIGPEIRIKDTIEVLEKEKDEQGCMGASQLLANAVGVYRDPRKPRDCYRLHGGD